MTFLNGKIKINGGRFLRRIERDCCYDSVENDIRAICSNSALDGMESLLLSLVMSGVITQSEDPRVNESLQTTLDAISDNL